MNQPPFRASASRGGHPTPGPPPFVYRLLLGPVFPRSLKK